MFHEDTRLTCMGGFLLPTLQITPEVITDLPPKINQSQLFCVCISTLAKHGSSVLCKVPYLRKLNTPAPAAAQAWLGRPCTPFLPRAAQGFMVATTLRGRGQQPSKSSPHQTAVWPGLRSRATPASCEPGASGFSPVCLLGERYLSWRPRRLLLQAKKRDNK